MLVVIYGLAVLGLCKANECFERKELEERLAWIDEEGWDLIKRNEISLFLFLFYIVRSPPIYIQEKGK